MCYSTDLRKKVIDFIDEKKSVIEASKLFKISRPTIYKWLKMSKTQGNLSDKKPKRPWKKIDPKLLISFVRTHSDLTLREYANHFKTSTVAICYAFKRLKITRKKRVVITEREMRLSVDYLWNVSDLTLKKI
jgi:putative transposase